jgi:hypothetical protein
MTDYSKKITQAERRYSKIMSRELDKAHQIIVTLGWDSPEAKAQSDKLQKLTDDHRLATKY